jgi:hypothetical protein
MLNIFAAAIGADRRAPALMVAFNMSISNCRLRGDPNGTLESLSHPYWPTAALNEMNAALLTCRGQWRRQIGFPLLKQIVDPIRGLLRGRSATAPSPRLITPIEPTRRKRPHRAPCRHDRSPRGKCREAVPVQ